jgi:hypothetical protein
MKILFTEDARFEGFAAAPNGADAETFVSGVARRLDGSITVHHCHQPEIVVTGTDTARGVWAMMDFNEWPHPIGLPGAPDAVGFVGFGFYEEEYKRVDSCWKIQFMRLTRLRLDPVEPNAKSLIAAHLQNKEWLRPSPGWISTSGDDRDRPRRPSSR